MLWFVSVEWLSDWGCACLLKRMVKHLFRLPPLSTWSQYKTTEEKATSRHVLIRLEVCIRIHNITGRSGFYSYVGRSQTSGCGCSVQTIQIWRGIFSPRVSNTAHAACHDCCTLHPTPVTALTCRVHFSFIPWFNKSNMHSYICTEA